MSTACSYFARVRRWEEAGAPLARSLVDLLDDALFLCGVDVVPDDLGPFLGQPPSVPAPDPAARAGDYDRFSIDDSHTVSYLCSCLLIRF